MRIVLRFMLIFFFFFLQADDAIGQNQSIQDAKYASLNIGINGLVGAIGALVNKNSSQKFWPVALKGFSQGALGGAFIHTGKHFTNQITVKEKLAYAWVARLTNSVGASMVQNAAANLNFWERVHLNVGITRIDYDFKKKNFKVRLVPSMMVGAGIMISQSKINWKKSLSTGTLFFESVDNLKFFGTSSRGLAGTNSIGIQKEYTNDFRLISHELMHVLQYDAMSSLNSFFNIKDATWKNTSKLYNGLAKFFYFDFNGPLQLLISQSQYKQEWICKYFEREAEHYSYRIVLPKCR